MECTIGINDVILVKYRKNIFSFGYIITEIIVNEKLLGDINQPLVIKYYNKNEIFIYYTDVNYNSYLIVNFKKNQRISTDIFIKIRNIINTIKVMNDRRISDIKKKENEQNVINNYFKYSKQQTVYGDGDLVKLEIQHNEEDFVEVVKLEGRSKYKLPKLYLKNGPFMFYTLNDKSLTIKQIDGEIITLNCYCKYHQIDFRHILSLMKLSWDRYNKMSYFLTE